MRSSATTWQVAERLLVTGFFDDALDALPVTSVATLVRTRLKEQLAVTLTGESAHG
jgi:hypothetical protein